MNDSFLTRYVVISDYYQLRMLTFMLIIVNMRLVYGYDSWTRIRRCMNLGSTCVQID